MIETRMSVLVVGGGGREAALVWKIRQSHLVGGIYAAPGNPGMAKYATCIDIAVTDIAALVAFAKRHNIGLTIVGPEGPLGLAIVDAFEAESLKIFGPTKVQAQLELSKVYCKQLLWDNDIPTAPGSICLSVEEAERAIDSASLPIVVKPDGCTEGKGVKICHTRDEAKVHVRSIMVDHIYAKTGDAGEKVVLEEFLEGPEASITVLTDGKNYIELATSEDHKQREDGDRGLMTGGMGAYSPSVIADALAAVIRTEIIEKLVRACPSYRGVLYVALKLTKDGPKVLEINCRFGDPETQVILPRMKADIVPIFWQIASGKLEMTFGTAVPVEWDSRPCVCVASVSGRYPESGYPKGEVITGIEAVEVMTDTIVFQAGTKQAGDQLVTNGGRVLCVSALGSSLDEAISRAYQGTKLIHFKSQEYRTDIARRSAV